MNMDDERIRDLQDELRKDTYGLDEEPDDAQESAYREADASLRDEIRSNDNRV